MIFRRRALPESLLAPYQAFADQVERLEAARAALMSCLPVGRVDPVPVPVGLDLLADTLDDLSAELPRWRAPEVERAWNLCVEAIAEARDAIGTAHHVARTSTELEELLGAVDDVDEPLGYAFGTAERAFRDLRQ